MTKKIFIFKFTFKYRDLGEQIRKHIKDLSSPATLTTEVSDNITKQIDSLERLTKNVYAKKYQRIHDSTATGLTAQQCNQVLSSEFLQYINEDSKKKK